MIEIADGDRADRRAVHPAASRLCADDHEPHHGVGPFRHRLRHPVRLHRPAVVRPVGVLRHRRHGRRLSAHHRRLSARRDLGDHRHDRGGDRRLSGRADRAAAHRHLFRDDHRRDRRSLLFRRVQSAVGLYRRRERPARRADADASARLHHHSLQHRLVALCVLRVLVFHRHRDRAAHRALAGRRRIQRHPRQPAARRRRRPQHPRLQAHRLRHRRRLCRLCRRPARRAAGLHAAGRLHLRYLGAAGHADRDRRRRHAVRAAARRGGVALSERLLPDDAASRRHLEAGAGRRLRAAGLLPAPRADRRHQGSLRAVARRGRRTSNRRSRPGPRHERGGRAERGARRNRRDSRRRTPCRARRRESDKFSGPILEATRPDQALRRPSRQQRHQLHRAATASCAASSAPTAPARRPFSRC